MNRFFILLSFLSIISCKTRYDDVPEGNYPSRPWGFIVEKNQVIIMNRDEHSAGSHGIYHKSQNYNISLPRSIISISASNSKNFINYGKRQVIMIDAGYKTKEFKKRGKWEKIIDRDKVISYIEDFYGIGNKRFDYDREILKKKLYYLYFDGQTYILFYNIKNSTKFDNEQILKSFKYIE